MVKLLARIVTYNWKHCAFSVLIFMLFWQAFSAFSAGKVAEDKLRTSVRQNAFLLETAFIDGDVVGAQRVLWRVKNDNIKRITFFPVDSAQSRWIFKEARVGNLFERAWAQKTFSIPLTSNGASLGRLDYVIDMVDVNAVVFRENFVLFGTVVGFFLGLLTISNLGAMRTLLAIERSVADINALVDHGKGDAIRDALRKHVQSLPRDAIGIPLGQMAGSMSDALVRAARLEGDLAVSKAVAEMAAQVAHDIRSPLAALDSILKDLSSLPEGKRLVVRTAVTRIRDIANDLIEKNRIFTASASGAEARPPARPEQASPEPLLTHIDPIMTEKRLQFRSRPGIVIEAGMDASSYGLFARFQPTDLKRALSNLINNAVEALGQKGSVVVRLSQADGRAIITVSDNGKGIPPEILAKLGQRGETHGKPGGSGLGLYHARACAESWGGCLEIQSEVGKGTTVSIMLPQATPPEWFVSRLELDSGSSVVVLDDDASIHHVWQGRFDSLRVKEYGIEILHLSSPTDLRCLLRDRPTLLSTALFLLDHEFLGQKETGLGLAEELGIGDKSILVTSRFEEQGILAGCQRLKVRMIPKGMAGFVPVSIREPQGHPAPAKTEKAGPDAVLLDDDALAQMTWRMAAQSKGLNLLGFRNPGDLLAALDRIPKETPIYLDCELADGLRGDAVAKDLHTKGFTNLYLATGHPPETLPAMPWIKKVVGKDPPWD